MSAIFTVTRPASDVPVVIKLTLAIALVAQAVFYSVQPEINTVKTKLPSPPSANYIALLGVGDRITAARLTMLWLQAFDNQSGLSLSLRELNYSRVTEWLDTILQLDSDMQYPLLAAARFYAEVPDPSRQRQIIAFIQAKFLERPDLRWSSMAHAVYVAKHRLKDLALAQECARLLRLHATADHVPYWARQMEYFVLEDMGELEAAKILIGGLLESGELDDPNQQRFLAGRLQQLEQQLQEQTSAEMQR